MIKQMGMEFISMLTDPNTKVNGKTINSMALVQSIGMIIASMLDSMLILKRKAKVSTCGQMETSTSANGGRTLFMEKEFTSGMMVEYTVANG